MSVSILFFLIAAIISVGYFGSWLFRVTRVPEAMLLIAAGYAIRSLLGVETDIFTDAAPYFGAFALVMILFEGGFNLEFKHLLKSWRNALTLLSIVFVLSFALIIFIAHFAFQHALLPSAVLASALACTSAAIVVPLIREVKVRKELQTVLGLESSLSDAVAVLIAVTLLSIAFDEGASSQIGTIIFSSLMGSLIIGTAAGFAWTWVLSRYLAGQSLTYLMTFAVMLLVYAGCEFVHSSGVFGVFLFGLAYANGPDLIARFWPKSRREQKIWDATDSDIKGFHAELTFLVRTFFYVFLGLIFDPGKITWEVGLEAVAIYCAILLARWGAVKMITLRGNAWEQRHAAKVLFLFMPRGLASAVLATLPLQYGMAGTHNFINITVLIILLTNLAITVGVRHIEKTGLPDPETKPEPPAKKPAKRS